MALTHKFTLIADDVRVENNGKLIVVGMYIGTIATSSIPFVLPTLTFLQCFEVDRPSDYYLKVKLQALDSGRTLSEAMFPLKNVNVGRPAVNIVKFGNVQFGNSGSYQLVTTIDDSRDPIIVPFDVVLVPQQQLSQSGR